MPECRDGATAARTRLLSPVVVTMATWQQIYKKSNKRAEKIEKIIAACNEAKTKKPSYWGEMSYEEWKAKVPPANPFKPSISTLQ